MKNIFLTLLALLLMVSASHAQPAFEHRSLEEVLNLDGTLKRGVQGSFSVKGYTMRMGANGEPVFVPQTQNAENGTWEPLGTGAQNGVDTTVFALAIDGSGKVYVGGLFTQAGGVSVNKVARFDPATNTWSALGTGAQNGVNGLGVATLAVDGSGKVYVGGLFTQAGGVNANNVARFDPATNTWSALGTGAQNGVGGNFPPVLALAIDGSGKVYVGGYFTEAGGVSANYVARFDPATNSWSVLGTGAQNGIGGVTDPFVSALAIDGSGKVYVGGEFTQAGGVSANYVARFDPATNSWSALGTDPQNGVGGGVSALAIDGSGQVYVGGPFNGPFTQHVARFDPATNSWSALGTGGVNGSVSALAIDGSGKVYVGGQFTQAGGVSANYVARFDPATNAWSALGTGAQNGVSGFSNYTRVEALAIDGSGRVYVGGRFTQAGGVPSAFIARWTSGTTRVEPIRADVPKAFLLEQNYPNPFNPSTTIRYQLPVASEVKLEVYDVLGKKVATLVRERQAAGVYQALWNASGLASGVYFYRLQAGNFVATKKMMLVK